MTFRILIGGLAMMVTCQLAFAAGPSPLRFNTPDRSYLSGSRPGSRVIAPRFGALERAPRYGVGMQGPSRQVPITAPRSSISFNTRGPQSNRSYPNHVYRPQVFSAQAMNTPQVMSPTSAIGPDSIPVLQRDSTGREFIVSGGQTIYFNQ